MAFTQTATGCTPSDSEVVLAGNGGIRLSRAQTYFAFGTGRLGYDCVTCGSQCCRGHGYRLSAGSEFVAQMAATPEMAFFIRPETDAHGTSGFMVTNCPPGCFFLTEAGRCGIQQTHGYDAKPETCRLFPFNNLRLVGGYLVVAPHSNLCPLSIVPPSRTAGESDHEFLFGQLAASGVTAKIEEARYEGDAAAALMSERRVVELSEAHLTDQNYLDFAAEQDRVGTGVSRENHRGTSRARMLSHLDLVLKVLGQDRSLCDGDLTQVTRTLVGATPFLRADLMFTVGSAPKHLQLPPQRVPQFLLGLFVLLAIARRAGMREVSFLTVMRLYQRERYLLTLLSLASDFLTWSGEAVLTPPPEASLDHLRRLVPVARALLSIPQVRCPARLGEVLCGIVDRQSPERFMSLRIIAATLIPVFSSPSEENQYLGSRRWRSQFRRLAWKHCDEGFLVSALDRARTRMLPERAQAKKQG